MDLFVVARKLKRERSGKTSGWPRNRPFVSAVSCGIRYAKPAAAIVLVLVMWLGSANAQLPFGPDFAALQKKKEPKLRITGFGRFQVFISPNIKGETFMIDTDTGRVWTFKKDHATGKHSLERVPVEQVDAKSKKAADSDASAENRKKSSGSDP